MRVVVWSERDEPYGAHRWRDCTYSSYLMGLVFGGRTTFARGIYTVAEREAFERSDSRPDETGSNLLNTDEAAGKRYGTPFVLKAPNLLHPTSLGLVGTALVMQGENGKLPARHPLRRWDPLFDGPHAWCVIPIGNGQVRVLDPLAPWRYEGDVTDIGTVIRWAYNPVFSRVVKADQFAPKVPTHTFHAAPGVYTTYAVVNGRARAIGSLPTRGFPAQYELLTAKQSDGTGTTTLLRITTTQYKGKLLYRFAPGISILS